MSTLEQNIALTKSLIDKYYNETKFKGVKPTYYWTNENVTDAFRVAMPKQKEKALSVLASGDQVFTLIGQGYKQIDTFDINLLSEYFVFGLKKAMILKYNYVDFLNMSDKLIANHSNNPQIIEELSAFINYLFQYMDPKYHLFWTEIFNYAMQKFEQKGIWNLFYLFRYALKTSNIRRTIGYLQDEDNYNKVRNGLNDCQINFKACDITQIADVFTEQYDFIYLSNILDYMELSWGENWDYKKLSEFERGLNKISNPNTIAILKYYVRYQKRLFRSELFWSSTVKQKDLKNEEIHLIEGTNPLYQDAIILKRGK